MRLAGRVICFRVMRVTCVCQAKSCHALSCICSAGAYAWVQRGFQRLDALPSPPPVTVRMQPVRIRTAHACVFGCMWLIRFRETNPVSFSHGDCRRGLACPRQRRYPSKCAQRCAWRLTKYDGSGCVVSRVSSHLTKYTPFCSLLFSLDPLTHTHTHW